MTFQEYISVCVVYLYNYHPVLGLVTYIVPIPIGYYLLYL